MSVDNIDTQIRIIAMFVVIGGVIFLLLCVTFMATFCGCCDVEVQQNKDEAEDNEQTVEKNEDGELKRKETLVCKNGKLHLNKNKTQNNQDTQKPDEVCIEMNVVNSLSPVSDESTALLSSGSKTPDTKRRSSKFSPSPVPRKNSC